MWCTPELYHSVLRIAGIPSCISGYLAVGLSGFHSPVRGRHSVTLQLHRPTWHLSRLAMPIVLQVSTKDASSVCDSLALHNLAQREKSTTRKIENIRIYLKSTLGNRVGDPRKICYLLCIYIGICCLLVVYAKLLGRFWLTKPLKRFPYDIGFLHQQVVTQFFRWQLDGNQWQGVY